MSSRKIDSEYGFGVFQKTHRNNLLSQKNIPRGTSQRSISNFSRQSQIDHYRASTKNDDVDIMVSKIEFNQEKVHELKKENQMLKKENHKLRKIKNGWSSKNYSVQNSQIDQDEIQIQLHQKNSQIEQLQKTVENLQLINTNIQNKANKQSQSQKGNDVKIAKKLQQKTNQVKQLKVQLQALQRENKNIIDTYKHKIESQQQSSEIKNQNALELLQNKIQFLEQENEQLKKTNQRQLQDQLKMEQQNINIIEQKMKDFELQFSQRPQMMVQSSQEFIRLLDLYKTKLREKDEENLKDRQYIHALKNQIHQLTIKLNEQSVKNQYQNNRHNVIQSCKNFSLQEMPLAQTQQHNIQQNPIEKNDLINFSFYQNEQSENKENSKQKQMENQILQQVLKNLEMERLTQQQQNIYNNKYIQ